MVGRYRKAKKGKEIFAGRIVKKQSREKKDALPQRHTLTRVSRTEPRESGRSEWGGRNGEDDNDGFELTMGPPRRGRGQGGLNHDKIRAFTCHQYILREDKPAT